jgi:uncharacterized coiled-coil protein SlyX
MVYADRELDKRVHDLELQVAGTMKTVETLCKDIVSLASTIKDLTDKIEGLVNAQEARLQQIEKTTTELSNGQDAQDKQIDETKKDFKWAIGAALTALLAFVFNFIATQAGK